MDDTDDRTSSGPAGVDGPAPERPPPSPAALRALAEAQARRAAIDAEAARIRSVREKDGRDGPEPVRYGDWEVKGLASDF
ncbi:MAG: DUF1674 domain-containing protein [Alsobacter sp.]